MKMNRGAVIDLPIRLAVVMAVLALSVPFIGSTLDYNEERTSAAVLESQVTRITNAAAVVYFSGEGSCRTVDLDIPSGCSISLGGDEGDAYSVRGIFDGKVVAKAYMDRPSVTFSSELSLCGKCTVLVKCSSENGLPTIDVIA